MEGPSADGYKVPPMKRERSVRLKYWSCNVKTVGLEEKEGEESTWTGGDNEKDDKERIKHEKTGDMAKLKRKKGLKKYASEL